MIARYFSYALKHKLTIPKKKRLNSTFEPASFSVYEIAYQYLVILLLTAVPSTNIRRMYMPGAWSCKCME